MASLPLFLFLLILLLLLRCISIAVDIRLFQHRLRVCHSVYMHYICVHMCVMRWRIWVLKTIVWYSDWFPMFIYSCMTELHVLCPTIIFVCHMYTAKWLICIASYETCLPNNCCSHQHFLCTLSLKCFKLMNICSLHCISKAFEFWYHKS